MTFCTSPVPPGDVWKKDSVKRWMPLSHAVHGDHPDMVETLLNQMNDPSSQSSKKEKLLSRTIDEVSKGFWNFADF